jgi:HemY protein
MRRVLVFTVLAIAAVLATYWLAQHPGSVDITWLGYRMELAVGLLVVIFLVFSAAVILLYRLVRGILRTPGRIGEVLTSGRRKRGYKALSQGMVAVAAGDAQEAARWSRRADDLLEDPPLTLLLQAQAAQLNGDEKAAEKYFNAMLEKPETRFLGLRGLLMQSLHAGDHERALGYVKQAHAMRPKTPWVVTNLFELSERTGDLDGAAAALKQAVKIRPCRAAKPITRAPSSPWPRRKSCWRKGAGTRPSPCRARPTAPPRISWPPRCCTHASRSSARPTAKRPRWSNAPGRARRAPNWRRFTGTRRPTPSRSTR